MASAATDSKHLPFEQRLRAYMASVARAFDAFRPFCRIAISILAEIIRELHR